MVVQPQVFGDGDQLVEGLPSAEEILRAGAPDTGSIHTLLERIEDLWIERDAAPVGARVIGGIVVWLHPISLAVRGPTAKRVASTVSAYAAAGSRST